MSPPNPKSDSKLPLDNQIVPRRTSARLQAFEAYATHGMHGKNWKKLGEGEREVCRLFIAANDSLDTGKFELAVNRIFLFKEKPKNWALITEFLTMANSAAKESKP